MQNNTNKRRHFTKLEVFLIIFVLICLAAFITTLIVKIIERAGEEETNVTRNLNQIDLDPTINLNQNKNVNSNLSVGDDPEKGLAENCGLASQKSTQAKGFDPVHSCVEEIMTINNEEVTYVEIKHGQGMDCPSGCIYQNYYGVVKGNDIYDLPQNYSKDYILSQVVPSKIRKEYGMGCGDFESDELSEQELMINLVEYKNSYAWQVIFRNTSSGDYELSGEAYVYVESGETVIDVSKILCI